MIDDDPDRFELDGDDYTARDVAGMLRRFADRPREKPPEPPTLADSAEFHAMAHQYLPVTNTEITEDGVTTVTGAAYVGRPLLGSIREEEPDDD
jgi:hypothetical protein